jgi:hypothetical protein
VIELGFNSRQLAPDHALTTRQDAFLVGSGSLLDGPGMMQRSHRKSVAKLDVEIFCDLTREAWTLSSFPTVQQGAMIRSLEFLGFQRAVPRGLWTQSRERTCMGSASCWAV